MRRCRRFKECRAGEEETSDPTSSPAASFSGNALVPVCHARSRRCSDRPPVLLQEEGRGFPMTVKTCPRASSQHAVKVAGFRLAWLRPRNEDKDRLRRLQRPQVGDRLACIRRTAEEFRSRGCALRRAPLEMGARRSALAWGCPLNMIYIGHRRSHDGINNHPSQRLVRALLVQTLFP